MDDHSTQNSSESSVPKEPKRRPRTLEMSPCELPKFVTLNNSCEPTPGSSITIEDRKYFTYDRFNKLRIREHSDLTCVPYEFPKNIQESNTPVRRLSDPTELLRSGANFKESRNDINESRTFERNPVMSHEDSQLIKLPTRATNTNESPNELLEQNAVINHDTSEHSVIPSTSFYASESPKVIKKNKTHEQNVVGKHNFNPFQNDEPFSDGSVTECDKEVYRILGNYSEIVDSPIGLKTFELDSYLTLPPRKDICNSEVRNATSNEGFFNDSFPSTSDDHYETASSSNSTFGGSAISSHVITVNSLLNEKNRTDNGSVLTVKVLDSTYTINGNMNLNEADSKPLEEVIEEKHHTTSVLTERNNSLFNGNSLFQNSGTDRVCLSRLEEDQTPAIRNESLFDDVETLITFDDDDLYYDIRLSQGQGNTLAPTPGDSIQNFSDPERGNTSSPEGAPILNCYKGLTPSLLWKNASLFDDDEILYDFPAPSCSRVVEVDAVNNDLGSDSHNEYSCGSDAPHEQESYSLNDNLDSPSYSSRETTSIDHTHENSHTCDLSKSQISTSSIGDCPETERAVLFENSPSPNSESFSQWLQSNGFRSVKYSDENDSNGINKKRSSWEYIFDEEPHDSNVRRNSESNLVVVERMIQPSTSGTGVRDYPSFLVISSKNYGPQHRDDVFNDSLIPVPMSLSSDGHTNIDNLYLDALKILEEESNDYIEKENTHKNDDMPNLATDDSDRPHINVNSMSVSSSILYNGESDSIPGGNDIQFLTNFRVSSTNIKINKTENESSLDNSASLLDNNLPIHVSKTDVWERTRLDTPSPSSAEFDMWFEHQDSYEELIKSKLMKNRKASEAMEMNESELKGVTDYKIEMNEDTETDDVPSRETNSVRRDEVIHATEAFKVSSSSEPFEIPIYNPDNVPNGDSSIFYNNQEITFIDNDTLVDVKLNTDERLEHHCGATVSSEFKDDFIPTQECLQESNRLLGGDSKLIGPEEQYSLSSKSDSYVSDSVVANPLDNVPIEVHVPNKEELMEELMKTLDDAFVNEDAIQTTELLDTKKEVEEIPTPPPRPSVSSRDYENIHNIKLPPSPPATENLCTGTISTNNTLPIGESLDKEIDNLSSEITPTNAGIETDEEPVFLEEASEPAHTSELCSCPKWATSHPPHSDSFLQPEDETEVDVETISISDINHEIKNTESTARGGNDGGPENLFDSPDSSILKPFGSESMELVCPYCRLAVMTEIKRKPSLMFACCVVPLFVDRMKNVEHWCPECKSLIGQYSWRPI